MPIPLKATCELCKGEPPVGFSCMRCLAYTREDPNRSAFSSLASFTDIDVGDLKELEPIWDKMADHPDGMYLMALVGFQLDTINRLFRLAVDTVKERV